MLLHVSSEYKDNVRPPPWTEAVARLVDRLTDMDQTVISLRRVNWPWQCYWRDLGTQGRRRLLAIGYFAPRMGIAMFLFHWLLARRVMRFLREENITPSLVHAHKMTFDGITGWLLARWFGVPLFFSIRGEVESKVFRAKPLYRPLFRRMARDARRIYYVSAWFRPAFERHTGVDPAKTALLPNIVHNVRSPIPIRAPDGRLVFVMSLRYIDKKGLPETLAAFASAGAALEGTTIEIIGEGPPETRQRVAELIAKNGLAGRVVLREPMANAALLEDIATATALIMPSHNETFGMVYPEALFAGLPILYSKGTGIDGYLDGLDVGVSVVPGSESEIRAGLITLVRDNARFRAAIRDSAGTLVERFSAERVEQRYRSDVAAAMEGRDP